jgi:small subunit ribosomal protein S6
MNSYEAMFLVNSSLDDKASKAVLDQIKEILVKNEGNIISSNIWAEKRSLCFPIKKNMEATYYLVNFMLKPDLIDTVKQTYRLNENVLRVLITKKE